MRTYNDYLEEVEEIIFNLVNELDVQSMNARIEQYMRENAALIQRNQDIKVDEDLAINRALEEEVRDFRIRRDMDMQLEQQERRSKRRNITNQSEGSVDNGATGQCDVGRGPSLVRRLARIIESKSRVAEENVFEDPLETPFIRQRPVQLLDIYHDPTLLEFKSDVFKSGGFSQSITFAKAISLLNIGLFVPTK